MLRTPQDYEGTVTVLPHWDLTELVSFLENFHGDDNQAHARLRRQVRAYQVPHVPTFARSAFTGTCATASVLRGRTFN